MTGPPTAETTGAGAGSESRAALVLKVVAISRAQQITKEARDGQEGSSHFSSLSSDFHFPPRTSFVLLRVLRVSVPSADFSIIPASLNGNSPRPQPWEKQNQGGELQETELPRNCPLHPIMRGHLKTGWKGSLAPLPTCICQLCGLGRLSPFCGPISLPWQRKGRWLKVMLQNSASQEKAD